jgi:hypothetical protein
MQARAQRYELGPALAVDRPFASIVIRASDNGFFLNHLYHLQRILNAGYEVIVVVDDPALWPEVYGRLLRRRQAIALPTILLNCAATYGEVQSRNLGIQSARGDVIVLMRPEVLILDRTALEESVLAIRTQSGGASEMVIGLSLEDEGGLRKPAGIAPTATLASERVEEGGAALLRLPPIPGEDGPHSVPAVTGGVIALSARLCQSLNGFSANYRHQAFADADLCFRARQMGAEIVARPGPGLRHVNLVSAATRDDHTFSSALASSDGIDFASRWRQVSRVEDLRPASTTGFARKGIRVRKRDSDRPRTSESDPHQPPLS